MTTEQKAHNKAVKAIPIYQGQKPNPETGKVDCPLVRSQKEWKREQYARRLLDRYYRRYRTEG